MQSSAISRACKAETEQWQSNGKAKGKREEESGLLFLSLFFIKTHVKKKKNWIKLTGWARALYKNTPSRIVQKEKIKKKKKKQLFLYYILS